MMSSRGGEKYNNKISSLSVPESRKYLLNGNGNFDMSLDLIVHSSEIRGLRSTKCSSETLQNLLYFFRFLFRATFYFYHMNALVYVDIDLAFIR